MKGSQAAGLVIENILFFFFYECKTKQKKQLQDDLNQRETKKQKVLHKKREKKETMRGAKEIL